MFEALRLPDRGFCVELGIAQARATRRRGSDGGRVESGSVMKGEVSAGHWGNISRT